MFCLLKGFKSSQNLILKYSILLPNYRSVTDISLNTIAYYHTFIVRDNEGARSNGIRVGRGTSGRRGKTCGRGHKGTKARSGGSVRLGFEGGQTPIYRKIPKIGFKAPYYISIFINLDLLMILSH